MQSKKRKRLLIIGGSGFIGSAIIRSAIEQDKYDIYSIDLKMNLDFDISKQFLIDIRNLDQLENAVINIQPANVIVLAARTDISSERSIDYSTNILGTLNIKHVVSKVTGLETVIWTSTQLVNELGNFTFDTGTFNPPNTYGESKAISEMIIGELSMTSPAKHIIVRPTTVWGEGFSNHYKSWFMAIQNNYYFHTGFGSVEKSFGYVGNVAFQYLKLLEAESTLVEGKIFYLSDYETITLDKFTNLVAREMGTRRPISLPLMVCKLIALVGDLINYFGYRFPYNTFRLNNIKKSYVVDLNETKELCGECPFSVTDGIKNTVEWMRNE
jgi:GlcNAc-P-P-Und epimerase